MKYLICLKSFVMMLFVCIGIGSCSSGSSKSDATIFDDPRAVTQKYFEAIAKNDLQEAKNYADKQMREALAANTENADVADDAKYNVLTAAINGNSAEVEVKVVTNTIKDDITLSVRLVKEAGKWLVSEVRNANLNMTGDGEDALKASAENLALSLNVYEDSKLSADLKTQKQALLDSLNKLKEEIKPGISLEVRSELQERLLDIQTNYAAFMAEVAAAQLPAQ